MLQFTKCQRIRRHSRAHAHTHTGARTHTRIPTKWSLWQNSLYVNIQCSNNGLHARWWVCAYSTRSKWCECNKPHQDEATNERKQFPYWNLYIDCICTGQECVKWKYSMRLLFNAVLLFLNFWIFSCIVFSVFFFVLF